MMCRIDFISFCRSPKGKEFVRSLLLPLLERHMYLNPESLVFTFVFGIISLQGCVVANL